MRLNLDVQWEELKYTGKKKVLCGILALEMKIHRFLSNNL